MAWAYVPLVAGGAVMNAVGAKRQADATSTAANYQAQVADNNAIAAEQSADYAIRSGQVKAGTQSQKGAALQGRVRAAIGASNINVNKGTPVDVQQSVAEQNKLDVETIIHNAQLEGQGYRNKAASFRSEAAMARARAANAQDAGDIGIAQSLIGGATAIGAGYAMGYLGKGTEAATAPAWSNPDFAGGTYEQFGWAGNY